MSRAGIVPAEKLRPVPRCGSHAGRLPGDGRLRRLVLPQRQARPVAGHRSGGTDVCTGFVGGVPTLPVYAGEIQAPHLGVAAHAFNERGENVVNEVGEFVITQPMPSMPVWLLGRHGRRAVPRFLFRRLPRGVAPGRLLQDQRPRRLLRAGPVGRHPEPARGADRHRGDLRACSPPSPRWTTRSSSTSTCPAAGSSCRCSSRWPTAVVLDDALARKICDRLRAEYTPRHVPDRIIQVQAIPVTLTGKKMEVPVRKILLGVPVGARRPTATRWPTRTRWRSSPTTPAPSRTTRSADRTARRRAGKERLCRTP